MALVAIADDDEPPPATPRTRLTSWDAWRRAHGARGGGGEVWGEGGVGKTTTAHECGVQRPSMKVFAVGPASTSCDCLPVGLLLEI